MPIYNEESKHLLEEYISARADESLAVTVLHSVLTTSGGMQAASEATEKMESAHAKSMDIYDRLQAYRLDTE